MISLSRVEKKFGRFTALKDITLNINSGEFYCLLGPNGAGKTTTLKLLSGLLKPSKGVINILNKDISKEFHTVKQHLGLIPETPFLYDNLTVYEFLDFIGSIFDVERKELTEKIGYYLNAFNFTDKKHQLIKSLSHGMKQRVSYIANFIHSPKILLIDEPFVGLDPQSIKTLKTLLKGHTQSGNTILMSTHILEIAENLADRIGILDKGELIVEGTLDELRRKVSLQKLEDIFLRLT